MDKSEMKAVYKHSKSDMGVYAFVCSLTGKAYIGCGQDIKGDINSITFRLNLGGFTSKSNLQGEWTKHGATNFVVEVLESLEYDKDESKTDYSADLMVLRGFCAERFSDFEFIN